MLKAPTPAEVEAFTGKPCPPDDDGYLLLCDFIDAANKEHEKHPEKEEAECLREVFNWVMADAGKPYRL